MFSPICQLGIFDLPPNEANDILRARAMLDLIDFFVRRNIEILETYPNLPLLRQSGVRYQFDRPNFPWRDKLAMMVAGGGACHSLVAEDLAELKVKQGINARPKFTRVDFFDPKSGIWKERFHILISMPDGTDRDPSKELGM